MIAPAVARRVIRLAQSGRTKPLIVECESTAADPVEVFCKISVGCDEGVTSLAKELVAATVARRLQLPVPVPLVVELPAGLADTVIDSSVRQRIQASSTMAFGSTRVPPQFATWRAGRRLDMSMLAVALATFVFDGIVENADRRPNNPNCLVAGQELWLIDHELAFPQGVVGSFGLPWDEGGLQWLQSQERHIFCAELRRKAGKLEFGPVRQSWLNIRDDFMENCQKSIPQEWNAAASMVEYALRRVQQARVNIDGVITEVRRVLR